MRKSIVALMLFCCISAFGQNPIKLYPLGDALQHFETIDSISFSFDPEVVRLIQIDFDYKAISITEGLEFINRSSPIAIDEISPGYYILAFKERSYQVTLSDSLDTKNLSDHFVTIIVNGNPVFSGKSSAEGIFIFDYKPRIDDKIEVYALGYKRHPITLNQILNTEKLSLQLTPATVYLEDLVIEDYLTEGISLDPIDQRISIKVADLPSLPGETDGDIFASLALLPGVSTPDNRPGNLFIRGSSTDQSLILYDNIPIYHRGHYFGTISPYNPKLVESVNVYRSGMHPRLGGRVGGAVEINSATELTQESSYGLGLNSLYATGYAKTALLKNKLGLAVAGRRSFPVTLSSPKLKAISDMVYDATSADNLSINPEASDFQVLYEDYNAKLEIPINKNTKLSMTGIYAGTFTGYTTAVDSIKDKQVNGFRNIGFNANLSTKVSKNVASRSSFTYSDYNVFFKQGGKSQVKSLENLTDLSVNQEFEFGSMQSILFTSGFSFNYQNIDFLFRGIKSPVNQPAYPVSNQGLTDSYSLSPYLSMLVNSIERLSLGIGVRGTYYTRKQDLAVLPRTYFSYDLSDRLMIKGSFGLYRQYLSQVKYLEFSGSGFDNELWLLADDKIDFIKGSQSMLGFLLSLGTLVFDVEFYNKTANNVTYSVDKRPENGFVFDNADQQTYGVDLFAKKKIFENADVWMGYTFSHIFLSFDSLKNVRYHSKYDQPHVFFIGGTLNKGNFSLSGNWRYASGLYAQSPEFLVAKTSFDQMSAGIPKTPGRPPIKSPFNGYPHRFKNVHTMDISASYKLPKKEGRPYQTTFGLSILNTYNQTNLTDQVTRAAEPSVLLVDRNAIGFAPNLMLMVEW